MLNYYSFLEKLNTDFKKIWNEEDVIDKETFEKLLPKNVDLLNDNAIFRCLHLTDDFYVVKSKDERKSAYTENYYTLIMNNLPSWKEYPKRQHICTSTPFDYRGGTIYRVIPLTNMNVGVCPGDDVQAEFIENEHTTELFNNYQTYSKYVYEKFDRIGFLSFYLGFKRYIEILLEDLFYNEFGKNDEIEHIVDKITTISDKDILTFKHDLEVNFKILKELRDFLTTLVTETNNELFNMIDIALDLLDINKLNELINPESLGFKCLDYDTYKHTDLGPARTFLHGDNKKQHEVWLDGDILLVKLKTYNDIWNDDRYITRY